METPDTFFPCPSCLVFISPLAHVCPTCKTPQGTTGVEPGELEKIRKILSELAAAASEPADLSEQPGRFRLASHVVGALFAVSIVAAVAIHGPPRVLGVLGAIVFGVLAIALYLGDLMAPDVRLRATGLQAIECYFKAVKSKRWPTALACLSPIARSHIPVVPPIPELGCARIASTFATVDGVKRYWVPFAHANFGMNRWIKWLRFTPITATPDVETYSVDLKIGYVKDLVERKTRSMTFPVTVIKHRSQWWLLTGEIYPRVDRALLAPAAASGQAS